MDAFLRRVIRQRQEEQARAYDPSSEHYRRYDETWARPEPAPKDLPPAPKVKHTCWCCGKVRRGRPPKFPGQACVECSRLTRETMLEKFRARQLKEFREKTGSCI
jgi:hypothetical protein